MTFSIKSPTITDPNDRFSYDHTLFQKSNFSPKIQFWQNPNIFMSFSPQIFLTIFLVKSKLSTAFKAKTTTFLRIFHPQKNREIFLEIKVEFLDKKWRFKQKPEIRDIFVWFSNIVGLQLLWHLDIWSGGPPLKKYWNKMKLENQRRSSAPL